jgi:hypothetical protein
VLFDASKYRFSGENNLVELKSIKIMPASNVLTLSRALKVGLGMAPAKFIVATASEKSLSETILFRLGINLGVDVESP